MYRLQVESKKQPGTYRVIPGLVYKTRRAAGDGLARLVSYKLRTDGAILRLKRVKA